MLLHRLLCVGAGRIQARGLGEEVGGEGGPLAVEGAGGDGWGGETGVGVEAGGAAVPVGGVEVVALFAV